MNGPHILVKRQPSDPRGWCIDIDNNHESLRLFNFPYIRGQSGSSEVLKGQACYRAAVLSSVSELPIRIDESTPDGKK